MRLKHIDKVTHCPHCGSDFGFYTRSYVKGWINDNESFKRGLNGEREKQNWEMYDHLTWGKSSDTCYCTQCDKPIATRK